LEIAMTLPGSDAIHRWHGRMLVDRNGQTVGRIETTYLDKATKQPEWALLEAGASSSAPTFVPLVNASEEGETVRVPFDRALVLTAPPMPADRELSEDQEVVLYRHYGVQYSRAESPSGLPAHEPATPTPPGPATAPEAATLVEPSVPPAPSTEGGPSVQPEPPSTRPEPSGEPVRPMEAPEVGEPTLEQPAVGAPAAGQPAAGAPAGVGGEPVAAAGPWPAGAEAPPSRAPAVGDALLARGRAAIRDPRVGAAVGAALALAAAAWRRDAIGRGLSAAIGAIPGTRRRRQGRRRARASSRR
jgi:hypothetical protein